MRVSIHFQVLNDNLNAFLKRLSFITKVCGKENLIKWFRDHFLAEYFHWKQYLQKSQLHISIIPPPCSAIMFICTLCSDILASVHGFSFSLPKHLPKDSLIKGPEYESDLFYLRVKFSFCFVLFPLKLSIYGTLMYVSGSY